MMLIASSIVCRLVVIDVPKIGNYFGNRENSGTFYFYFLSKAN